MARAVSHSHCTALPSMVSAIFSGRMLKPVVNISGSTINRLSFTALRWRSIRCRF